MYFSVIFFACFSFFNSILFRNIRAFRIIAIITIFLTIFILSLTSNDVIFQDKSQYYSWYRLAHADIFNRTAPDKFFSFLMILFPNNLTLDFFWGLLVMLVFLLIFSVLNLLANHEFFEYEYFPLILLVILFDRLFLDLSLNAVRSTISILIFILGTLQKKSYLKYVLFLASLGTHFYVGVMTLFMYFFGKLLKICNERKNPLIIVLAVTIFLFRIYFSDKGLLSFIEMGHEFFLGSERFWRGINTRSNFSLSIAMQIFLSIVLPLFFVCITKNKFCNSNDQMPFIIKNHRNSQRELFVFAIVCSLFGLMLYPDFSLFERFFAIPIILLPCFMSLGKLRLLATIKFISFTLIICIWLSK